MGIDLKNYKKLHFIGIGGISMSGLAEILFNKGFDISGSDRTKSELTDYLERSGIKVFIGHRAENIQNRELVIYTAAIPSDNPELAGARESGIITAERSELLGAMMDEYEFSLSVAGTHGKTTVSSMLSEIFMLAGKNPTITVGGILQSINSNYKIGSNEYFIVESCEYHDSFLQFRPYSAIILNIEKDHTDYFKSMEQMYDSFHKFAARINKNGILVINGEIENIDKVINNIDCRVITYGRDKQNDWFAENVRFDADGCSEFDACRENSRPIHIRLKVPGIHNVYNALAACALSAEHGISAEQAAAGLLAFSGAKRRFEYLGSYNGASVIDDYAHHPTEIKATLNAACAHDINRLFCVFQPHTYSRTIALLDEFAQCFDKADEVVLVDIYAAREKDTGEVHSTDLAGKISERGVKVSYFAGFDEAEEYVKGLLQPRDMLITLGAGNVNLIGKKLVSQ